MLQEADYGMTDMAFSQNARYAGDDRLWVQFHLAPMVNQGKSDQEGRPIFEDKEFIRILMPGNKDSIIDRPITDMDKARFADRYAKWKAQEKELVEGTLLESVARDPMLRLNPSQIAELQYFNIRTVEQLAEVPDVQAQKFMGIQVLKAAAKKYLEASKDNAQTTRLEAELEQRDHKIAALEVALTDLQERLQVKEDAQKHTLKRPPKTA